MLPSPIKKFIDLFAKLPGIGPRQASRIVFWLIHRGSADLRMLRQALEDIEKAIAVCRRCFFVYEHDANKSELCDICRDPRRDQSVLAVVEKETDLLTIEKTKHFKGLYHVLGSTLSPLREHATGLLRIRELEERIKKEKFGEVILALSPTTAGDYTAMELEKKLKPLGVKITRLGRGLPRGAEVEFADEETLSSALESRK